MGNGASAEQNGAAPTTTNVYGDISTNVYGNNQVQTRTLAVAKSIPHLLHEGKQASKRVSSAADEKTAEPAPTAEPATTATPVEESDKPKLTTTEQTESKTQLGEKKDNEEEVQPATPSSAAATTSTDGDDTAARLMARLHERKARKAAKRDKRKKVPKKESGGKEATPVDAETASRLARLKEQSCTVRIPYGERGVCVRLGVLVCCGGLRGEVRRGERGAGMGVKGTWTGRDRNGGRAELWRVWVTCAACAPASSS